MAPFFAKHADIGKRDPKDFPQHYLELYKPELRASDCAGSEHPGQECRQALETVAEYFNPNTLQAPDNDIGIALEGGGTKAASFALGVLAGLQELGLLESQPKLSEPRIGSISSISGGSYAASYFYNRWFDRLNEPNDTGTPADWFRSCIPDYFILDQHFNALRSQALQARCGEKTEDTLSKNYNEFYEKYEYIGHVWKNHDLLLSDSSGNLRTSAIGLREYGNLALLFGETTLTIPFQFLARSVFRWPLNSAPSKLAYKLGLERQYGYSPKEWKAAGSTDFAHMEETLERRKYRTLENFHQKLQATDDAKIHIPLWILGTTAPGNIGISHWLYPQPRDPLRQQFELTWNGYGSGTYGYARRPPDAPFDFLGRNPDGLPILDAVVASASFFDDDQTQKSAQPFRFFAGAAQHFLNITWFTELRNFQDGFDDRLLAKLLPWPAYFGLMSEEGKAPYIHLQDGGNSENSGILPLLRRGYKTIIYAHGTQDENAEFESICHLKNQLELDGTYIIRSDDFERLMKGRPLLPLIPTSNKQFDNHLDELCSSQLDDSDLAAFDENPNRDEAERIPAVAKLFCGRLGYRDPYAAPCAEFVEKFKQEDKKSVRKVVTDLFFNWHAHDTLSFKVYRKDVLKSDEHISTIITIVPGIALDDLKMQVTGGDSDKVSNWNEWCALDEASRQNQQIKYCYGPDDKMFGELSSSGQKAALSCSSLAQVLNDACTGGNDKRPNFPQDDFILQTMHTIYPSYAAYFDLARHQVRHAVCYGPDYGSLRPSRCSAKP